MGAGDCSGIYVAIGSNIDPERNFARAIERLGDFVTIAALSTVYRTRPIERPQQDDFLNAVIAIETALPPRALKFEVLRAIESELGRTRAGDPYGARTIDLDLILYRDQCIDEPDLTVPDPDILQRSFLAVPLVELEPALVAPGAGVRLCELAIVRRPEGLSAQPALTAELRKRLR